MKSWARVNQLFLIFTSILVIILLFAFLDFLLHSLSAEYAVPPRYFPNKIIYGTFYGFALFLVIRKQRLFTKALVFSLIVDISLQVRYFMEGYPFGFVFLFLILHFIVLFPISWIIFKFMDMKKLDLV